MKILFVEDDHNISSVVKEIFLYTNHDVILSPNPKTAIQALEADHFDAIILDMNFPEATGETVLKFIYKNKINVPVIIHTGYLNKYSSIFDYYMSLGIIKKIYQKPVSNLIEMVESIDKVSKI